MRSSTGKKHSAVLHWLDKTAAHGENAFLDDRSGKQLPVVLCLESRPQLIQDHLVRPVVNIVIWVALNIHALEFRRARADEGKSALMIGIDQFMRRWGSLHQDAQPAEGIGASIYAQS